MDPDSVNGDLVIIENIKNELMDIINDNNDEYISLSKIIFSIQDHKLWL